MDRALRLLPAQLPAGWIPVLPGRGHPAPAARLVGVGPILQGEGSEVGTVAKNSAVQVVMSLFNRVIDFAFAMLRLRVLEPRGRRQLRLRDHLLRDRRDRHPVRPRHAGHSRCRGQEGPGAQVPGECDRAAHRAVAGQRACDRPRAHCLRAFQQPAERRRNPDHRVLHGLPLLRQHRGRAVVHLHGVREDGVPGQHRHRRHRRQGRSGRPRAAAAVQPRLRRPGRCRCGDEHRSRWSGSGCCSSARCCAHTSVPLTLGQSRPGPRSPLSPSPQRRCRSSRCPPQPRVRPKWNRAAPGGSICICSGTCCASPGR